MEPVTLPSRKLYFRVIYQENKVAVASAHRGMKVGLKSEVTGLKPFLHRSMDGLKFINFQKHCSIRELRVVGNLV